MARTQNGRRREKHFQINTRMETARKDFVVVKENLRSIREVERLGAQQKIA